MSLYFKTNVFVAMADVVIPFKNKGLLTIGTKKCCAKFILQREQNNQVYVHVVFQSGLKLFVCMYDDNAGSWSQTQSDIHPVDGADLCSCDCSVTDDTVNIVLLCK